MDVLADAFMPVGIIFSTFQGELRVETQQVLVRPDAGENERPLFDIDRGFSMFPYYDIHALIIA